VDLALAFPAEYGNTLEGNTIKGPIPESAIRFFRFFRLVRFIRLTKLLKVSEFIEADLSFNEKGEFPLINK
jgi:hypothetical protein